tara:strand:- start:1305 stop:1667 length:363 start_codon:yes stop_codon:yes gene_type:complete
MTNYIKWNGISEDGSDGDKKWGNADFTWGDYQLVVEVADVIAVPDGAGGAEKRRQKALDQWLDKDEEKKKKLIRLICRIDGEKVYDEEKEAGTGKVSVDKVEMLIKEILGKIKLETKDVL